MTQLEVQFQSELYLALIVLPVSGRSDLTELGGVGVIERTWSGGNAIAREARVCEIRMIGQIEKF